MKLETLNQLTWEDIMEIYHYAGEAYYESTTEDSEEKIFTDALNRLKEMAK
jgi:hypothetical protein